MLNTNQQITITEFFGIFSVTQTVIDRDYLQKGGGISYLDNSKSLHQLIADALMCIAFLAYVLKHVCLTLPFL